jgi:hypothetical protein
LELLAEEDRLLQSLLMKLEAKNQQENGEEKKPARRARK